jgi:hypothetical protein
MKTFVALAASLAVNAAILGTLEWSAYEAQTPPAGVVTVTQTDDEAGLLAYEAPDQSLVLADKAAGSPDLLAYKRGRAAQLLL